MKGANLNSLEAIKQFKIAMIEFTEDAKLALMEAHADVQKTTAWITHDRVPYWTHQVKKRHEKVQQAKSDLYRAQLQSRDERPTALLERKMLARAEESLAEAQRKIEACRKAVLLLDREGLLFKAALAGFSTSLELDLPNAAAHLERLLDTLTKYLSITAPKDLSAQPRENVSRTEQGGASP